MPAPRPEPPDPKKIVDAVLAEMPATALDTTLEQRARLTVAQDELVEIAEAFTREWKAKVTVKGPQVVTSRSMWARWNRIERAHDRLMAYMAPLVDYIDQHDEVSADG